MKKIFHILFIFLISSSGQAQFFNHIDSLKKFADNPKTTFSIPIFISDHDSIPIDKKIRNLDLLKNILLNVDELKVFNSAITEIANMDSIIGCNGIKIFNNGYLKKISGFQNIKEFARIEIYSNSSLDSINFTITRIKDFDQIQISDNLSLKSIRFNFDCIINDSADLANPGIYCNYHFLFNNNDSLKEIKMETKDRFISSFNVYENKRLEKIWVNKFNYDYKNQLKEYDIRDYYVGKRSYRTYLYLEDNPMLREFAGFDADSITLSSCYIHGNTQLNNLCLLQYYFNHFKFPSMDMKKYFVIDSNAAGANSLAEVMNKNCKTAAADNITVESNIVLYPNPAKENVTIEGINNISEVSCYTLLGRDCTNLIEKHEKSINVRKLQNGVYFIKTKEAGNISNCYKFIKESYE